MLLNLHTNAPVRREAPEAARASVRSAPGRRLFDGGDSLLDDDTMRSNWAVPWSDLMMTMFVLFAALLAAQTIHGRAEQKKLQRTPTTVTLPQIVERVKIVNQRVPVTRPASDGPPASAPDGNADPLAQINVLARSHDAVRESNLQNVEIALLDDQSVKVSVQGPTFFAPGKADLRPEVTQFLDRLAQIIRQTPYDIHIIGHTDDRAIRTGMFPSNWELSLVRASRVARYLIDTGGINPLRFMVTGRGEYEPLSANSDEQSRALNRRVDIIITRDIDQTRGAKQP